MPPLTSRDGRPARGAVLAEGTADRIDSLRSGRLVWSRARHWKCRNGRTPFASSNLARSATTFGSSRRCRPQGVVSAITIVATTNPQAGSRRRHFLKIGPAGVEMPRTAVNYKLLVSASRVSAGWVDFVIQNGLE